MDSLAQNTKEVKTTLGNSRREYVIELTDQMLSGAITSIEAWHKVKETLQELVEQNMEYKAESILKELYRNYVRTKKLKMSYIIRVCPPKMALPAYD